MSLVRMVKLLKKVRNMLGMCKIFTLTFQFKVIKAKSQIVNIQLQSQLNQGKLIYYPPPTNVPGMMMGPEEVLSVAASSRYSD